MKINFYLKKGDNGPPIKAILKDAYGLPMNITGATVKLIATPFSGTTPKINAACRIVDAVGGEVWYGEPWAPTDVDTVGVFKFEYEVKWPDGTETTFPRKGYKYFQIQPELG